MMKFLIDNNCSITMKEAKGDTIKEYIMRYARDDNNLMINTYIKYEDKMIINRIFSAHNGKIEW